MSSRTNKRTKRVRGGGRLPFNHLASQLRETLENRIAAAQEEEPGGSVNQNVAPATRGRHPAHLRGRDIGMFYARQQGPQALEIALVSFLKFNINFYFNSMYF